MRLAKQPTTNNQQRNPQKKPRRQIAFGAIQILQWSSWLALK